MIDNNKKATSKPNSPVRPTSEPRPFIQFQPVIYVEIDFEECHRLSSSVFDRLVIRTKQHKSGGFGVRPK